MGNGTARLRTARSAIAPCRAITHQNKRAQIMFPLYPAFMELKNNCMVPKENHIGRFPANFCVKMIGTSREFFKLFLFHSLKNLIFLVETGEHLVIRTCVLEDMNNQCGTFRFENETYTGCILTCNFDGCNAAINLSNTFILLLFSVLIHSAL